MKEPLFVGYASDDEPPFCWDGGWPAGLLVSNHFYQPVELQTLLPRDGALSHVKLPRTDLQETALRAGIERLAGRLVQRRKAVLPDPYDVVAEVHRFAHDGLLPCGYRSTHEHAASLSTSQPLLSP